MIKICRSWTAGPQDPARTQQKPRKPSCRHYQAPKFQPHQHHKISQANACRISGNRSLTALARSSENNVLPWTEINPHAAPSAIAWTQDMCSLLMHKPWYWIPRVRHASIRAPLPADTSKTLWIRSSSSKAKHKAMACSPAKTTAVVFSVLVWCWDRRT